MKASSHCVLASFWQKSSRRLGCLFVGMGLAASPMAHAWTAAEVDFPGDWNGWSLDCPTFKYTGPDGFGEWFRMYAVLGANVNPFNFKMVTGNNWDQDYGGNLTFQKNTWDIMYYQPLSDTASQLVGGGQAGKRYIFTVKDPGLANSFISVQEISNDPVEITAVSGGSGFGFSTNLPVVVTMTLSDQPSPEERAYVRFSFNNFATYGIATSSIAQVTNLAFGQGGTTTTIVWQATARFTPTVGNTSYKWYAFTTTASSNQLQTAGGVGVDALTLAWNNNGGQNFELSTFGPFTPGAPTNFYHQIAGGTNRMVFQFAPGKGVAEVVAYAADMIRVRWHWDGLYEKDDIGIDRTPADFAPFAVNITTGGGLVTMTLPDITAEIHTTGEFRVHVKNADGEYLLKSYRFEYDTFYDPVIDGTYDNLRYARQLPVNYKVKAIMESPSDEGYFGLGSEARSLNRRGRNIQMWNSDTFQWEEDWNPMYNTFPFMYGVRTNGTAYGLFFNNPARPVFRLGTQNIDGNVNQHYSFEAGDGQIDYFVIGGGTGNTMPAILTRYSELTGLPKFVPKWTLGYQQCRWSYHSQQWIQELAQEFVDRQFPLDVLYLDLDYFDQGFPEDIAYEGSSQLHQLIFNSTTYWNGFANVPYWPDPAAMIDYCLDRGVRLIPIIEPWINNTDPKWNEAASLLHFVKDVDGNQVVTPIFFGNVSWIDFTSTSAGNWWKGKLSNFFNSYPFEAVWNDLNEPADAETLPRNALYWMDGRFGSNFDSRRWHVNVKNTYCIFETKVTFEALKEQYPDRRPYVISRAGYPGIQKYATSWSGDNKSDPQAARYNIRLGNSVMISGQVNFGHDIGGFVTETTDERLTRWMQWGALNPLMRNHSMKTAAQREPVRYTGDYFEWMRDLTWFRYRLMPLLYTMTWSVSQDGIPMNAPTVFFFHQQDPRTFYDNETEIMVGEHLLVAPMWEEGSRSRVVYLPNVGTWYYWPSGKKSAGEKFAGGQFVTVPAPMSVLPMFVREGAIIPMSAAMQNVFEFHPHFLDLMVWPSTNATSFLLYEDDGLTMAHTNSSGYAKTLFSSQKFTNRWVFDIGARDGGYDAYPDGTRVFQVKAQDIPMVDDVTANGAPLTRYGDKTVLLADAASGWAYDTADRTLYVKVPETFATNRIEAAFRSGWTPYTPASFASSYDRMAVAANFNLWNPAARNMRLVDNYIWAGVISVSNYNNARFKFAANDNWNVQWGDNNQGDTSVPINLEVAESGGGDIVIDGVMNGLYSFEFNEVTGQYRVNFAADYDSDRDGMNDGWEVAHGLDPLEAQDAAGDLNNDGLSNGENFALGGDPLASDTDGDGYSDLQEAIAGTDLTDPESFFVFSGEGSPAGAVLQWNGLTGRFYDVYYATSLLNQINWIPLPDATNIPGIMGPMAITNQANTDLFRALRLGVERP
ncbi:MAG TPA: glycoside hydrolase family 31 protein [Kiritimatiellia bacterium]|nr:glycoside hydrolase family 31 protein [Kiritimatiellia bacterium]